MEIGGLTRTKDGMDSFANRQLQRLTGLLPVLALFMLGMLLVIVLPMGFNLARVPGDLGDARFNNYVLEHFYRWLSGQLPGYWNAAFFYPFPATMAFSDTLLGSAPLYALFRWVGLDFYTAFQLWFITGAALNFIAAAWVLWQARLKALAVGMGAFFFAFGLPLLAQENHAQLLYHFCVPLACYSLWKLFNERKLVHLVMLALFVVWQVYLTIYLGIFLLMLLAVMAVLLAVLSPARGFRQRVMLWPRKLWRAFTGTPALGKILGVLSILLLGAGFLALMLVYYRVNRLYGFARNILEVYSMLPRFKSYLLADNSQVWGALSEVIKNVPMRWEHQLFVGLAVIILVITGTVVRFRYGSSRLARVCLLSALALILLTLAVYGLSFYWLVWLLPGVRALRAITRIILVIMWPLAFYAAWCTDGIMRYSRGHSRWLLVGVYLLAALMVTESVFYNHVTYSKAEAVARLERMKSQIPAELPNDPVLFAARDHQEPYWAKELDAMLLSQQLDWPTLNGYSGNNPPDYLFPDTCRSVPQRIINYMHFAGITDVNFYLEMMKRVVPVGFTGCDPAWWKQMP